MLILYLKTNVSSAQDSYLNPLTKDCIDECPSNFKEEPSFGFNVFNVPKLILKDVLHAILNIV